MKERATIAFPRRRPFLGALDAFEKSVAQNPNDSIAQYRLGTAYLRVGKAALAVVHLRAALKLGGPDKPTLYNLELALRKTGRLKESEQTHKQMESLMQANRQSSAASLRVANLNTEGMKLEDEGKLAEASAKYRLALDLDPTAAGIRLNYGLSLCRLHQWKDGIAEIQEVVRVEPDNGRAAKALFIAREQAKAGTAPAKQP